MKLLLALPLIFLFSVPAFSKVIKPSELDFSDAQLRTGEKCFEVAPGASYLTINPECAKPLVDAANKIVNLMNSPAKRVEWANCDIREMGKYDDVVCTIVVLGDSDERGCAFQQADFRVKFSGPNSAAKIVARTAFQFYCESSEQSYVYKGLRAVSSK